MNDDFVDDNSVETLVFFSIVILALLKWIYWNVWVFCILLFEFGIFILVEFVVFWFFVDWFGFFLLFWKFNLRIVVLLDGILWYWKFWILLSDFLVLLKLNVGVLWCFCFLVVICKLFLFFLLWFFSLVFFVECFLDLWKYFVILEIYVVLDFLVEFCEFEIWLVFEYLLLSEKVLKLFDLLLLLFK